MTTRRLKGQADDANRAMWRLYNAEDWGGIQQCLARGEWDANRPLVFDIQPGGLLLLYAAAVGGQMALAKQLLELGADPNANMPGQPQLLFEVCQKNDLAMVELLINAGADVNAKCSISDDGDPGETPLMDAMTFGYREMAELLLRHGARANVTTHRGRSALSIAMDNGQGKPEMVRFLLDAGCPVDPRDLHYPVRWRNLEMFQLLLARQPDVNKRFDWPTDYRSPLKHDTPLFVAVEQVDDELGREPQRAPRRAERLAIIDLLIAAGANVNAQRGAKGTGWTPLMWAMAAQEDDEIANRLIAAGADPTREFVIKWRVMDRENGKTHAGPISAVELVEVCRKNAEAMKHILGQSTKPEPTA